MNERQPNYVLEELDDVYGQAVSNRIDRRRSQRRSRGVSNIDRERVDQSRKPLQRGCVAIRREIEVAIIPQVYATKKPCVRWKVYKDEMRRPTTEELDYWYHHFHFAGIIGLLGPASGLIAIDVDGEAAHVELVRRLGEIPLAPQSWRGKEYRYHLFFGSCEATVGLRRVNGY